AAPLGIGHNWVIAGLADVVAALQRHFVPYAGQDRGDYRFAYFAALAFPEGIQYLIVTFDLMDLDQIVQFLPAIGEMLTHRFANVFSLFFHGVRQDVLHQGYTPAATGPCFGTGFQGIEGFTSFADGLDQPTFCYPLATADDRA